MNVLFFVFISFRIFLLCSLLLLLLLLLLFSPPFPSSPSFTTPLPGSTHTPTKNKEREARKQSSQTNQECCRNLFLSIILRFPFFPAAAIAEIAAAVIEGLVLWRRRRRRRMMIRSEGLVGGGGGGGGW